MAANALLQAKPYLRHRRLPDLRLRARPLWLALQGSRGLLLERRAEASTLHRSALRRCLLHPLGSQTSLGDPHRRLPRPRIPSPTLLHHLRRHRRRLRRHCRAHREPRRLRRAHVLRRRVRVAGDRGCHNRCVYCEIQHRGEGAGAGPAEPLRVLLRRRRPRRIPRQRVLRAPAWTPGTNTEPRDFMNSA